MRNEMHSFAATPQANIPRSRFDMPCNVKFTGNTGKLIPFYVCEVLPGDTFEINTSLVARLQTLIHPLMDNIYLDTYYFFVPNRLVMKDWAHFCGEPNQAWVASREYRVPTYVIAIDTASGSGWSGNNTAEKIADWYNSAFKDSILDYMGIGLSSNLVPNVTINCLPIRGYHKIFDDWFRDENLQDPMLLHDDDLSKMFQTKADYNHSGDDYQIKVHDAPKLHDYFTSALPQAQRGNPVELVFGNSMAPVITGVVHDVGPNPLKGVNSISAGDVPVKVAATTNPSGSTSQPLSVLASTSGSSGFYPSNLYATLNGVSSGININDLRMAFQVQKWLERSARGGARYIELLKSMFGVTSPDARLQRSEYLGGHRVPINIHQVVNTSETVETPLGNTGAMSVTSDVHNDFIHSFVEHGYVIGICTIRYKHTYPQGMDRMWSRLTKFDYYWPVFANIGEQPIRNKEIFLDPAGIDSTGVRTQDKVFGYQEAWADYRFKPNRAMGEMRPGVPNSLASWTLSDYYTTQPVLSSSWIKEDLMPVDRAIAVQSSEADQWLFDVLINNKATRPMPLYSIPGLVDHF